jgi:hypothetical protein
VTAPQPKLTGSSVLWCARCNEWTEPYSMDHADMADRGAIGWMHDVASGVTLYRLPYGGPLVATDTLLCQGCDAVLAPYCAEAGK